MNIDEQVEAFNKQGFLRVANVYNEAEITAMTEDLEWLLNVWAITNQGWSGPWRKAYMDDNTEKASKLTHLHDLQFYTESWNQAVGNKKLLAVLGGILGPNVELHHTTLHLKPPQTGHPFPMHQDMAFYEHENGQYVDVLVHLDDTCHENGEIRFLEGSHKWGYLPHVTMTEDGPCTPHLPTDKYRLEDTVAVPAKRGDVVLFNVNTIHGSYINQTQKARRMVRLGYRDPANRQSSGQSHDRLGRMVLGRRAALAVPSSREGAAEIKARREEAQFVN